MKINIKDVFEKQTGDVRIHTNDRLDVEEVFAEALADDRQKDAEAESSQAEPEPEREEKLKEPESEDLQKEPPEPEDIQKEPEPEQQSETDESNEAVQQEADPSSSETCEPLESEEIQEPEAELEETAEPLDTVELSGELEPHDTDEVSEASEETDEHNDEEESIKSDETEEKEQETNLADDSDDDLAAEHVDSMTDEDAEKPHMSYRQYGWQTGLAAAFVALIAIVFVYTTMIPREVNATINGEDFTFSSKAHTVESFLEEEGIEFCDEDYLSLSPDAFIYDGISLEIKHATDFKVTADGRTKQYKSLANTVEEALIDVNIEVGDKDIVEPEPDAILTKDMEVVVKRVEIETATVEEKTPFKTVTKNDDSLDEGTSKVVTKGVKGTDKVTYEITYIDGKEKSRKEIKRETVEKAVDKVVANGTRISYNGQSYSRKLVVKAYAYTGGGRTAMGTAARVGEIAVDPSVIPLGSNVYIEGVGARRAEDTGGNIKGNTIDIYMNTQSQCISWGARYVTIYIQ